MRGSDNNSAQTGVTITGDYKRSAYLIDENALCEIPFHRYRRRHPTIVELRGEDGSRSQVIENNLVSKRYSSYFIII